MKGPGFVYVITIIHMTAMIYLIIIACTFTYMALVSLHTQNRVARVAGVYRDLCDTNYRHGIHV